MQPEQDEEEQEAAALRLLPRLSLPPHRNQYLSRCLWIR